MKLYIHLRNMLATKIVQYLKTKSYAETLYRSLYLQRILASLLKSTVLTISVRNDYIPSWQEEKLDILLEEPDFVRSMQEQRQQISSSFMYTASRS